MRIVWDLRDPDQSCVGSISHANVRQWLRWDRRAAEGWILQLDGACDPMDVGWGQKPGRSAADVVAGQPVGLDPGRGQMATQGNRPVATFTLPWVTPKKKPVLRVLASK